MTIGLDVDGPGGGQWLCQLRKGVPAMHRGLTTGADVIYRMDRATFEAIVCGRQSPQDAFLARTIEIDGDLEKGLKLAVLFDHFVKECPYAQDALQEETDAVPLLI